MTEDEVISTIERNVTDENENEREISRVNICCCIKPNDRSVGFGSCMLCSSSLVFWGFWILLFCTIGAAACFVYTAYLIGTSSQEVYSRFSVWIFFSWSMPVCRVQNNKKHLQKKK